MEAKRLRLLFLIPVGTGVWALGVWDNEGVTLHLTATLGLGLWGVRTSWVLVKGLCRSWRLSGGVGSKSVGDFEEAWDDRLF